jgi:hypothetical protein
MRPHHHAFLRESVQIAARGHGGNGKLMRQIAYRNLATLFDKVQNFSPALFRQEPRIFTVTHFLPACSLRPRGAGGATNLGVFRCRKKKEKEIQTKDEDFFGASSANRQSNIFQQNRDFTLIGMGFPYLSFAYYKFVFYSTNSRLRRKIARRRETL